MTKEKKSSPRMNSFSFVMRVMREKFIVMREMREKGFYAGENFQNMRET